jgi:hypothetical protein
MEKRFLQSSTFVLMSGIMLQSAVPADATLEQIDNNIGIVVLGVTVMTAVIGASAYFLWIMVTEITKYVLLFQDVRRWTSGSDDDLGARGAAHADMRRSKHGVMHNIEAWLKRHLLKDMYYGEGMQKKKSSSTQKLSGASPKKSSSGSRRGLSGSSVDSLASTANPMHTPVEPKRESISSSIGLGDVFTSSPKHDTFSSGENPFYGSARNVLAAAAGQKHNSIKAPTPPDASRLRSRSRSFGSMDSFVDNLLNTTALPAAVPSPASSVARRASLQSPSGADDQNQLFVPSNTEQQKLV